MRRILRDALFLFCFQKMNKHENSAEFPQRCGSMVAHHGADNLTKVVLAAWLTGDRELVAYLISAPFPSSGVLASCAGKPRLLGAVPMSVYTTMPGHAPPLAWQS